MKSSHASLLLLSAIVICLCGQPHPAYVTAAGASELHYSSVASEDGLPEEAVAASGLGGLDGATLPAGPKRDAVAARDTVAGNATEDAHGATLSRNDTREPAQMPGKPRHPEE